MLALLDSARSLTQVCKRLIFSFIYSLCLLLMLSGCEGSTVIVNDLDERDANEIIVYLAGNHIQAEKIAHVAGTGGAQTAAWNVAVKKSEKMAALTLLNNSGLPRKKSQNLLALFQKQGLVSSEMEERIRYQAGLAEQIASTIRKIDGVLDADIQISFPPEDTVPGQNRIVEPATASVYVKHQGILDNPNSHLILKIKRLVASAIPGLDADRVTVIADRAIFNDPMSLALSKSPDLVSVWGIKVVKTYVIRLQLILFGLLSLSLILAACLGWVMWKLSRLLPQVGGVKSLFKIEPWKLSSEEESSEEDLEASEGSGNEGESQGPQS